MAVKAHELLGAISRSLKLGLAAQRGDAAVKAFLEKVDGLQEQLDELRDISHEH